MMRIYSIILTLLIYTISVNSANAQIEKFNKFELGSHGSYFFDERQFQVDDLFPIPLYLLSSFGYIRVLQNTNMEIQVKLCALNSKSRSEDYFQKGILNKSYYEAYGYYLLNLLIPAVKRDWFKAYINTGLIHRRGIEAYYPYIGTWEGVSNLRYTHDFGFSLGFRIESKAIHNFYLYFQPQYNYYVYRQDKNFLQNEITGTAGIGYYLNFKKKK